MKLMYRIGNDVNAAGNPHEKCVYEPEIDPLLAGIMIPTRLIRIGAFPVF